MPDNSTQQRIAALPTDSPLLKLPQPKRYSHLIDYLIGIGFCRSGESATRAISKDRVRSITIPVPLDFAEIKAWADVTNKRLTEFEAETLRLMSEHYCIGMLNSLSISALPPYESRTKEQLRAAAASSFKALMNKAKQEI